MYQKEQNDFPRPKNFIYDKVIFFDGNVAVIFGEYKDWGYKSLGMRWMLGESKLGYPSLFGKPMWMVIPDQFAIYILKGILEATREFEIIDFELLKHALKTIEEREAKK